MGRGWLHYASGRGKEEDEKMVSKYATEDEKTVSKYATEDEQMVSKYRNGRLSINIRDDRNLTPLHFACHNGHVNMVKLLLEKGANVDAQTVNGSSPLHFAALDGHDEVAGRLILKMHPPA